MAPTKSWKWDDLESRYLALTSQNAGFYTGADYDAIWINILSMLQVQSTEANDVVEIFPDVAKGFWGATGWVDLDENGDRKPGIFDIWGYYERDGEAGFQKYGEYNGISITVTWYDDLITEQDVTRPGPP